MARKILLNQVGNNIPLANNGLKLSKNILIESIEPHPKFQELFNIEEDLKNRIAEDMGGNGFDPSQPIHIWNCTDENGVQHNYLIDGYTRLAAAKQAGLGMVPYYEHNFSTFEEAHRYVLHLQIDRRNLDSNTLLLNLRELMGSDYVKNIKGQKSEVLADELGVSKRTVDKAIFVEKNATPEQKDRIKSGEASINKIYQEHHPQSKKTEVDKAESIEKSVDEISQNSLEETKDSISDNTGTPSSLNFSHTDGIERPNISPTSESELDKWTQEKNRQTESARMEGFAEGFEKALIFVLAEVKKGRTPEEIYNDKRLIDLSPSVIYKFNLPSEDEDIIGEFNNESCSQKN